MGRRSRSPDASFPGAPAEKMAKTSDTEDVRSDNANNADGLGVLHNSTVVPMTPQETAAGITTLNQSAMMGDAQTSAVRIKRQDWCRWPICKDYYGGRVCPYEENIDKDGNLCQLAHVRVDDGVSVNADSCVRVCFDSMGLIQPACRRAKCSFFHPPKHIRDQIIARRHAQYLQEKQVKMIRNQLSNALMQMPSATAVSPYVCFTDPIQNLALNQYLMYNNGMTPEWTTANLLAANKNAYMANDVNGVKLFQTMNFDPSVLFYPQLLPSAAVYPSVNWAEYVAKMNAPCLQRPDAITPYNWLPVTPVNAPLMGAVVPPPTAFAFQPLGSMNGFAPTITVHQTSNVVPCVPGSSTVQNVTR